MARTEPDRGNWSSFGKRQVPEAPKPTDAAPSTMYHPRNSLMSHIETMIPNMPVAPADKWQQSAIRRKKTPPPAPEKTFEELFPSLGSTSAHSAAPKPVLSMADRMKQKLKEEEEERQRKEAELALEKKNRKKENYHVIGLRNLSNFQQKLEMDDDMEEDYDSLDHDVYGINKSCAGPTRHYDDREEEGYDSYGEEI